MEDICSSHTDPYPQPRQAPINIHRPLRWAEGNEFGFYGWGNMPTGRPLYLINNYRYAHWVLNLSVMNPELSPDIGSNLRSIEHLILDSFHATSSNSLTLYKPFPVKKLWLNPPTVFSMTQ